MNLVLYLSRVRSSDLLGGILAAEKLESENPEHDESDTPDARECKRLSEEYDAKYGRPDGTYAGPYCVRRSDWKLSQRQPKQPEAQCSSKQRNWSEVMLGEAVRSLHASSPYDLKQPGRYEKQPRKI